MPLFAAMWLHCCREGASIVTQTGTANTARDGPYRTPTPDHCGINYPKCPWMSNSRRYARAYGGYRVVARAAVIIDTPPRIASREWQQCVWVNRGTDPFAPAGQQDAFAPAMRLRNRVMMIPH